MTPTYPKCGKETDQPVHTCLVKPTPETDVPIAVIEAARLIVTWASMNNLSEFELNGICDRKRIYKLEQELNDALNKVAQYEMDTGLDAACKTLMHERDQLKQELNDVRDELDRLAHQMVFRGNSVAYIYQKKEVYRNIIDECCRLFVMDGKTSVVDLIKSSIHERDQLRKVADELAKQLENHVSICGGREHHKDNCEAPEYPCHDCELNDAIDIALKNHNQLPHVKERNEK